MPALTQYFNRICNYSFKIKARYKHITVKQGVMFCENFAFFAKLFFDDNFAFRLFAKNAKIFALFAKFRLNLFRKKLRNFCEKQISKISQKITEVLVMI